MSIRMRMDIFMQVVDDGDGRYRATVVPLAYGRAVSVAVMFNGVEVGFSPWTFEASAYSAMRLFKVVVLQPFDPSRARDFELTRLIRQRRLLTLDGCAADETAMRQVAACV